MKASTLRSQLTAINFIGFTAVLIGAFLINYNYVNRLDIISDDDDLYFSFGMMLLKGKYRGADDGPVYYVFQLIMQLITNDSIRTFYINYILMTTVPLILFYFLLRVRGINVWLSIWVTLLFMFSVLNYPVTPKLTHYAIIYLMLALIAFSNSKELIHKLLYCGIFVFLASYARPELYLAYFALAILTGLIGLKTRNFKPFLILLIMTFVCGYFFGTPIGANDRSFWTFKHHFSINYIDTHPELNLSPWNHFNQITTQAFGHQLTSVKDAILTDPGLIFWHIKLNILNYFKFVGKYAINIMFDSIQFPFRKYVLLAIMLFILVIIDYRMTWNKIKTRLRDNWIFLAIFLLILGPTYISNFFIYPRTHYIVYHFFLYLFVLAMILDCIVFRRIRVGSIVPQFSSLIVGVFNIIFLILLYIPKYKENSLSKPQPMKAFAFMLRECNIKGNVIAFGGDAPFSYNRYVGENWTFYYHDIVRPSNFNAFLMSNKVNCVIVNNKMNSFFEKDKTYHQFVENPLASGFTLVKDTGSHQVYAKSGSI